MSEPGSKTVIHVDFSTKKKISEQEHFLALEKRFQDTKAAFEAEYVAFLPGLLTELQEIDSVMKGFEEIAGFLTNYHEWEVPKKGPGVVGKIYPEAEKKMFEDYRIANLHWEAAVKRFSDLRMAWNRKFDTLITEARTLQGSQELIREIEQCIDRLTMRIDDFDTRIRSDFLKKVGSYVSQEVETPLS